MDKTAQKTALDVACLLARIMQIDQESTPRHWLWTDRIMKCDVPRMLQIPGVQEMMQGLTSYSETEVKAGE